MGFAEPPVGWAHSQSTGRIKYEDTISSGEIKILHLLENRLGCWTYSFSILLVSTHELNQYINGGEVSCKILILLAPITELTDCLHHLLPENAWS